MGISGGIYRGELGRYLALYSSFHEDIYIKPPPEFNCEYLLHFRYSKGGWRGGGDAFLLKGNSQIRREMTKKVMKNPLDGRIYLDVKAPRIEFICFEESQLSDVDKKHNVSWEIQKSTLTSKKMQEEVMILTRADILQHGGGKYAKENLETRITYIDKIIPVTRLKEINRPRSKILDGGKPWFYPQCGLEANTDSSEQCRTGWIPEKNFSFDGKNFVGYFAYPWGECEYCYAKDKRGSQSYPKTIYTFDENQLERELLGDCCLEFGSNKPLGKPVEILRFGKRTEPCTPETHDSFIRTLEIMLKIGTRGVITQKMLSFEKEKAKLLKRTNSVLLHSIGWDFLEKGCEMQMQSCTNEWRLEQMIKYREKGVNAIPYLLIVAHNPITEREKKIIKLDTPIQLIPIRFNSKRLVKKLTEECWDYLNSAKHPGENDQGELFYEEYSPKGSCVVEHGELVTLKIHPDWLKLIGDNNGKIRMCHHNNQTFYCGRCFQGRGFIAKTVKPEIDKKSRWDRIREKRKSDIQKDSNQSSFGF